MRPVFLITLLLLTGCSGSSWWVIKDVPVMYSGAPVEKIGGCPYGYAGGCREVIEK
jgi:hypothetical protein